MSRYFNTLGEVLTMIKDQQLFGAFDLKSKWTGGMCYYNFKPAYRYEDGKFKINHGRFFNILITPDEAPTAEKKIREVLESNFTTFVGTEMSYKNFEALFNAYEPQKLYYCVEHKVSNSQIEKVVLKYAYEEWGWNYLINNKNPDMDLVRFYYVIRDGHVVKTKTIDGKQVIDLKIYISERKEVNGEFIKKNRKDLGKFVKYVLDENYGDHSFYKIDTCGYNSKSKWVHFVLSAKKELESIA